MLGGRGFDKHIYESRLNQRMIEVKIAADDNLHHNRSSVQYLVEDLRKLHPKGRFIGVRDKDYMTLLGQCCPDGIYVTDHRDLEMTILCSASFTSSDNNLTDYLADILPHCIQMAYIRIYAESRNLRKRVSEKMNVTAVYDQQSKCYIDDPKSFLRQVYLSEIDTSSSIVEIDNYVNTNNLSSFSAYNLCRGHDVIGLMGHVYGISYSRISMEEKMEKHYSKSDFYKTLLFAKINRYCSSFGIDAKST